MYIDGVGVVPCERYQHYCHTCIKRAVGDRGEATLWNAATSRRECVKMQAPAPMPMSKARIPTWHAQAQATMQEIRAAERAPDSGGGERRDNLLSLRTMGFREKAALEALRLAEGNVAFAIELLLSAPDMEDKEGEADKVGTAPESDKAENEAVVENDEQLAITAPPVPEKLVAEESVAAKLTEGADTRDHSAEPVKAEERVAAEKSVVAVERECQDSEIADGTESEADDWELV